MDYFLKIIILTDNINAAFNENFIYSSRSDKQTRWIKKATVGFLKTQPSLSLSYFVI